MKTLKLVLASLLITIGVNAQSKATKLLNKVSAKVEGYKNMTIDFSSKFVNKEAGILDEAPINGKIIISGEKYNLDYLGNKFIFDGKNLAVINNEEQEISTSKGDMDEDGFIYPSKLVSFYKTGFNYKLGKLKTIAGRKIQYIEFTPIDKKSKMRHISLGVDAKTKHIYQLIQTGLNGATTTLTILKFKGNQPISNNLFKFDKAKYQKLGYLID